MDIKINEMERAEMGDVVSIEGKVFRLKEPNSNDFEGTIVWSQFIVVKDDTGEQGCWLKLDSEDEKVTKGSSIKIKGKVGKEYKDNRGNTKRSINNCDFEIVGKVQAPAQSSTQSSPKTNGNDRDNYWEKKFIWDQKVHFSIIRECAIKAVTELAKISSKTFTIKVHTEEDFFEFSDKIVAYICKKRTETKESIKEERIKKAREVVGKTEFKPASTAQKNVIFGYRDSKGWHKGMIESRYITKEEIRDIGNPDKLSVESASEWLSMWWGESDEIGERAKREMENPRNEDGTLIGALVKGDKTSLVKDVLIDEINALRRENFLSDDVKFKEELGYNSDFEELTEKELKTLKDLLKNYHPKDWDEK